MGGFNFEDYGLGIGPVTGNFDVELVVSVKIQVCLGKIKYI